MLESAHFVFLGVCRDYYTPSHAIILTRLQALQITARISNFTEDFLGNGAFVVETPGFPGMLPRVTPDVPK